MPNKGTVRRRNQDIIDNIGRNIRKYRKLKGLTIVELSYLAKVEAKQISRLELGQNDPTASTLSFISEALKIDITQLFEKEQD